MSRLGLILMHWVLLGFIKRRSEEAISFFDAQCTLSIVIPYESVMDGRGGGGGQKQTNNRTIIVLGNNTQQLGI